VLAAAMYDSADYGLETSLSDAINLLTLDYGAGRAEALVNALRYARLVRVGGHNPSFSFVHRRFAEFFVVDRLRGQDTELGLGSIPTDSRWRDCLVMHCGIADAAVRKMVADYCWSVIETSAGALTQGVSAATHGAIHSMRFIRDAFRDTPDALESFRADMGLLAVGLVSSEDVLVAKLGAELIPLLDDSAQEVAVLRAFSRGSQWIRETALGSCRHIARLNDQTKHAIREHFRGLSFTELAARFSDYDFSLSLSDAFRPLRFALRADLVEAVLLRAFLAAALVAGALLAPSAVGKWLVFALGLMIMMIFDEIGSPSPLSTAIRRGGSYSVAALRVMAITTGPFLFLPFLVMQCFSYPSRAFVLGLLIVIGVPGVVLFMGWELLASIPSRLSRWKSGVTKFFRLILDPSVMFGIPVAVSILFGITRWPAIVAPVAIVSVLVALRHSAIAFVRSSARGLVELVRRTFWTIRDRRRLRVLGVPRQITSMELYATVSGIRSNRVREEYVRAIRSNRVRLIGDLLPAPSTLLIDTGLADELARLHEQWHGLAV